MVFKSGKIIVIGSESEKDAEMAAKKLGKDIQKALNAKCKLSEFRITNLVANADLGFQLDLHRLADERYAVKDDSFPGVVYRNLKNLKSALIFHSGKVIFTGATLRDPIEQAYDELKIKLRKF
jgi:TATA-box binding protein (TBP) (component of TFIID and TFIIIB)